MLGLDALQFRRRSALQRGALAISSSIAFSTFANGSPGRAVAWMINMSGNLRQISGGLHIRGDLIVIDQPLVQTRRLAG